jgi:hypothetical protein
MAEGVQFIKPELPDWASVFVFGSSLTSDEPGDLDLLVVYDLHRCAVGQARDRAEELVAKLAANIPLARHVVVLSEGEEQSVDFVRRRGCMPFAKWFEAHGRALMAERGL